MTPPTNVPTEPTAVFPPEFRRALRDALAHLDELPFHRHHPLVDWLLPAKPGNQGERLRDMLLVALAELRPPESLPADVPAWRRYRSLQLRYLDYERPHAAADMLAISERQARREHHGALEVLATLLWQRRPGAANGTAFAGAPIADPIEAVPSADVAGTVASMGETLGPLLREQGAELDLALPERLPEVAVDRVAVRQAVLAVILAGLENGCRRFRLTASVEAEGVQLHLGIDAGCAHASLGIHEADRLLAGRGAQVRGDDLASEIVFSLPRRRSLILLVDDDPDFARLFERCLAGSPYTMATLPAGEDAVARTRALRPDYVVLDVFLPSQDGWEVLQRLKNDPATREVPVLICSALANPSLARTLGAAGCLPKPVTPRALLGALDRCRAAV
ncbi:MAG TPA: response regulator [Chloroflexota bacterium]|nr:response regulator [Chloroflexota bacterium]